jgi:hypothetical protein
VGEYQENAFPKRKFTRFDDILERFFMRLNLFVDRLGHPELLIPAYTTDHRRAYQREAGSLTSLVRPTSIRDERAPPMAFEV